MHVKTRLSFYSMLLMKYSSMKMMFHTAFMKLKGQKKLQSNSEAFPKPQDLQEPVAHTQ